MEAGLVVAEGSLNVQRVNPPLCLQVEPQALRMACAERTLRGGDHSVIQSFQRDLRNDLTFVLQPAQAAWERSPGTFLVEHRSLLPQWGAATDPKDCGPP